MDIKVTKYRNKINKLEEEQYKKRLFNTSNTQLIDKLVEEVNINNVSNSSIHIDGYQNNVSIILSVDDYYDKYELSNGFFVRKDNIVDINMTYLLRDITINNNEIPELTEFEQIIKNTITILKLVKNKKLTFKFNELDLNLINKFIFNYLK